MRPGVALLLAACLALAGCGRANHPPAAGPPPPCDFDTVAGSALKAIAAADFVTLATLVHPERGVRFSPYAHVDPATDRVLSAADLESAGDDRTVYRWGAFDGTGEPIDLTVGQYFSRFVYSHGFLDAPRRAVGRRLGTGNSIDNIAEIYPQGRFVEYYVPGVNPDYGGMDWGSLRLVLTGDAGCWRLVGVVHDQWTI